MNTETISRTDPKHPFFRVKDVQVEFTARINKKTTRAKVFVIAQDVVDNKADIEYELDEISIRYKGKLDFRLVHY